MKAFFAKHPILALTILAALVWFIYAEYQAYQNAQGSTNGFKSTVLNP